MTDVRVAGTRLEVAEIPGRAAGRAPIVLLHEGLGSLGLWRDFPGQLAKRTGSAVFAYSRHGYGRSASLREKRAPDYMHHEARVVLPALLDALGVERPVLFGHSDGASIALIFAGERAHAPSGLILEAPHVFVEERSVQSIAATRAAYETPGNSLRERLGRWHDDVDATFYGWNDIWLDPRFRAWNIEPCASGVRCPVLLLQGDRDEYGTTAQLDAITARVPSAERHLIADAAHSPHREQPEAVLSHVVAFVERLHAGSAEP